MRRKEAIVKSFVFSLLYVGLGTLSLFSLYPTFFLSGDWAWIGFLLTIPVSAIGFGVIFMEPENEALVLLIQLIHLIILWLFAYLFLRRRRSARRKLKRATSDRDVQS
jgi:hypothetical protein